MYQPILLEKTVIKDPFLFPLAADNVLMFLGAKASISFDERVRDVRRSLQILEAHLKWISDGMPREENVRHIIPTEEQIEKFRINTLKAIYIDNEHLKGLYIHCRRQEADRLFESADKAAAFISARTPVKGQLGQDFFLRARDEKFGFRNEELKKPACIENEPEISDNLRAVISLSAHFAAAAQLFNPSGPRAFPNQLFFPHIPQVLRSILLINHQDVETLNYDYKMVSNEGIMKINFSDAAEAESRIVTFPKAAEIGRYLQSWFKIENKNGVIYEGPVTTAVFASEIFSPLFRHAVRTLGEEKAMQSLDKHLEIFALSQPGQICRGDFIKDFIPSL